MAHSTEKWVMSCKQCSEKLRNDRKKTRLPVKNPNEHITTPENAMQIDLVQELPQYGGQENIVIAMNVYYKNFLPTPHLIKTSKQSPESYLTSRLSTPTYQ